MQNPSKVFKALSNKNRLAIFEYLRQHDLNVAELDQGPNVGEVAEQFNLALSTISHHLRVLHEAGLIICEQRGQQTFCTINHDMLETICSYFDDE